MIRAKNKIRNPQPKLAGKGIELLSSFFTTMPPMNPPILLPMKEIPKKVPRLLRLVTCLKKLDHMGMINPIPSA